MAVARSRRRSRAWLWILLPVGVVLVLVVGFGNFRAVPFTLMVSSGPTCTGGVACSFHANAQFLPAGQNISVRWTDVAGEMSVVRVLSPSGSALPICLERGSSGICHVLSIGGNYTFVVYSLNSTAQTVDFSGTYYLPFF